jgi:ferrous iron transport protein B
VESQSLERIDASGSAAFKSVLIFGNPNSGKSLIFNRLTGLRQKVANFPGVTMEIRSGQGGADCEEFRFLDFPGVYSLNALSADEALAVSELDRALLDPELDTVLYVADATRLERSLYLFLQLRPRVLAAGKSLVFACNVLDEVIGRGQKIDLESLGKDLGVPVIGVSARRGLGLDKLRLALRTKPIGVQAMNALGSSASVDDLKRVASELARKRADSPDVLLLSQQKLDRLFLHPVGGPLAFIAIMGVLFQSIFTWSGPLMDAVSSGIEALGSLVSSWLAEGFVSSFVQDAVFGGLGSFLVFAPQIFVLFVLLGVLEDSGYLARAAVLCHRPLSVFGLSGKSFVPLLSGAACSIPAILATRSIEDPRKRQITRWMIPFMVCSARLPVYSLLIAAFVPSVAIFGGFFGLQGAVLLSLYVLGVVAALLGSALVSRWSSAKGTMLPFVVEMPPYRTPHWKPILRNAGSRTVDFVKKAGGIIFLITVFIWALGYFPNHGSDLTQSYLADLGRWVAPVFEPLGWDWRVSVAVLMSFLAREVFVATLATMAGLAALADDSVGLAAQLPGLGITLPAALALLVFYAFALQCVSTLAVIRKESGSWREPVILFGVNTILAYAAAWVVYQLASLL